MQEPQYTRTILTTLYVCEDKQVVTNAGMGTVYEFSGQEDGIMLSISVNLCPICGKAHEFEEMM